MNLESIISITGKPGLFKVLSKIKNGLVVESISDGKKMPVHASDKVSALSDISIYTYEGDIPLVDVYEKMFEKTGGKTTIEHKSKPEELRSYIKEIIEDIDEERVYNSDLKKLFQWFNLLVSNGLLKPEKKEKEKEKTKKEPKAKKEEKTDKAAKPKKAAPKKKPAAKKEK